MTVARGPDLLEAGFAPLGNAETIHGDKHIVGLPFLMSEQQRRNSAAWSNGTTPTNRCRSCRGLEVISLLVGSSNCGSAYLRRCCSRCLLAEIGPLVSLKAVVTNSKDAVILPA
jgi:hypothetical protein